MAKQLVPVANQPILHYALESLYQGGARDFGLIISPETGEAIQASVAQWQTQRPDIRVTFILQDAPRGLAHAVLIAEAFLADEPFVMYLGDNLINHKLADLVADFAAHPCEASLLVTPVTDPTQFGVAKLDAAGHVVQLVEKPKHPPSNLALIGVYLLTSAIFPAIRNIQPSWRGELEITDALQMLMQQGGRVRCQVHTGWWLDTGKKDDLLAANQVVLGDYVRQTRNHGQVCPESILEGPVEIGVGSQLLRSRVRGPVRIGKNCILEDADIGPCASIADGCTLRRVQLENSVLLANSVIEGVPGRIRASVIGESCRIVGSAAPAVDNEFMLVNQSDIVLATME
jgi:glucose-1-phosphate thymidylyltransferase